MSGNNILKASIQVPDRIETPAPIIGQNGNWWSWDTTKEQFVDTATKAQGIDGKDAARVRDNLWNPKVFSFRQNDAFGCRITTLPDRTYRIDKVEASKRSFKSASYYTHPIRHPKGRYTISFKVVETSRPIRYFYRNEIDKQSGDLVGDFYYWSVESDGRLPAFAFTWGKAGTDDEAIIGDYAIIKDIKIERIEEGEDPRHTAYIPHPSDLKGDKGDKGDRGPTGPTGPKGDPGKDVDPTLLNGIQQGLSNANTLIATLEKTAKELKEGKLDTKDLPDLQYLLNALQKGDTKIAGGLVLSKIIALSNQVDRITAYLSGYDGTSGDGKILRAGIQYTKTKEDVKPIRSFLTDYCGYKNVEAIPHVNNVITKEALFTWLRQQKEPFEKFYKALSGGTVSFNPSINSSKIDLSKTNAIIYSHSDSNSEAVAIRHDGTGHFGDIHLNGDRIDYQETQDANPYLTVGRGTYSTIEEVIRKNDYRAYNPSNIADKSFDYNPDWNTGDEQVSTVEIEVANDNTKVTITVELMRVDTRIYAKNPDKPGWVHTELQAKLNGHHIKGVMEMYNYGYMHEMPAHPEYSSEHWDSNRGPGIPTDKTGRREWLLVEGNKRSRSVEHSVILPKGTHQLEFVFSQVASSDEHSLPATAIVEGIKVLQEYRTSFKQALISPTGARFYGGRDRYFDINYNAYSNAPTAQLTGGLKVDYIDMPGVPLCGATFNSSGGHVKSFGRYRNRSGNDYPSAWYDYSNGTYTIYHSIPHSRYIPLVTPFGTSGDNRNWNLSVRVYDVSAYSFTIRLLTNNDNTARNGFSYIAFQAE